MTERELRHDPEPDGAGEERPEEDLGHLVGKAVEIAVYAPISILLDGPRMLPQLAEQGKVHVKNAQWLGRMFLQRSGKDIRKRAEEAGLQAYDLLKMLGVIPDEAAGGGSSDSDDHRAPVTRLRPVGPVVAPGPPEGPASDDLAIPDYDSLSASHVVNRLPGLSPDELDEVYTYESSRRGRKTILNKIAQLRTE